MLNLFQLRAFDAVAREGSFTRAAEKLFITQPAITGHVKALESHYQVRLVRRGAGRVSLTEEGEHLAGITRALFGLADEAETWLQERRQALAGQLTLFADSPQQAMPLLARMRERHPGVVLRLRLGNARQALDAVLREQADIALTTAATPRSGLYLQPLSCSALLLQLPAGHPWASLASVELAALLGQPLLLREVGSVTRQAFEEACADAGLALPGGLELGSREAVAEAVAAGLGLGVVLSGETGQDARLSTVALEGVPRLAPHMLACLDRYRGLRLVRTFLELAGPGADDGVDCAAKAV